MSNLPVPVTTDGALKVAHSPPEKILELIEVLKGMRALDLDCLRIPSGGGLFWEIQTSDGPVPKPTVKGVILAWRDFHAMWRAGLAEGGGKSPPDCFSADCEIGYGVRWDEPEPDDPGPHTCVSCPLFQFGSDGRGKKCQARRAVFFLPSDSIVPVRFNLPPTSVIAVRKWAMRLLRDDRTPFDVETEWALAKAENSDGVDYAVANPKWVRALKPEEIQAVSRIKAQVERIFRIERAEAHPEAAKP
jgi:hypothetical protein